MYHGVTRDADPNDDRDETAPTPDAPARKERVLHTRIPAVLEQELKRFAENLRVPVSNLVRTILEDAISAADRAGGRVEEQLREFAGRVSSDREVLREKLRKLDPLETVIAWQPVLVARASTCARCGAALMLGTDAWLGIRSEPGPAAMLCSACVPRSRP